MREVLIALSVKCHEDIALQVVHFVLAVDLTDDTLVVVLDIFPLVHLTKGALG